MTMILGDYIGFDESKLIEFKEFILKIDPTSFFENEDIKNMVCTGKVLPNFNVLNSVEDVVKLGVDYCVVSAPTACH